MKRILFKIIFILIVFIPSISFADWNDWKVSGGLFFNVTILSNELNIRTTIPNKVYPAAGIKILTPGYTLANPGVDCAPIGNGFCLFPVSDKIQRNIVINGPAPGNIRIKLCLNGRGPLSCQDYTVSKVSCAIAGGQIVADLCWINQVVTTSTSSAPLSCSTVCNAVGLTLQNPGPTNSVSLAGDVCAKFGYTSSPFNVAPCTTLTFIGQIDAAGATSCFWQAGTDGTDWSNPQGCSYGSDATGHYMCPCVNPG